jgi:hypothetical protein
VLPRPRRAPGRGARGRRQGRRRSRTDETIPGHLFNTHSAAHNIINMTRIPAELDLAGAGSSTSRWSRSPPASSATAGSCASTAASSRPSRPSPSTTGGGRGVPRLHAPRRPAGADGGHRASRAARRPGGVLKGAPTSWSRCCRASRAPAGPIGLARDLVTPYGALLERTCERADARARWPPSPATPPPGRTRRAARSTCSGRRPTTCSGSGTRAAARRR